jgi:hypothetical protein
MKRLVTAILAILYMGTSMGATFHLHYCMGKLAAWNITFTKSAACQFCNIEKSTVKSKSCCSDEQRVIKTSGDQKAAENSFQAIYPITDAIPSDAVEAPVHIVSITEANPFSNGPPQSGGIAIYIRNRVFRI